MPQPLRSRSLAYFPSGVALLVATVWGAQAMAQAEPPKTTPETVPTTVPPQAAVSRLKLETAKPPRKLLTNEKATKQLDTVVVTGVVSDTEQRRAFTAAKIVVTKEEIERYGDSSVADVLKRLPGVTSGGRPGRGGGDVRMRGMGGGYTQLLVNGERMGPGYSLADIPPDQVERIEIVRAPTAEFGARAVAGTVNVVLKQALKRKANEFRAGVGVENGRASPMLSWTRNDKVGEDLNYTFTLSAMHQDRWDDNDSRTHWLDGPNALVALDQHETGESNSLRDGLNVNGRIQWTLGEGETLSVMPFLVYSQGSSQAVSRLIQAPGGVIAALYGSYQSDVSNTFAMARTNAQWQKRLSDALKMDLRAGAGQTRGDGESVRQEYAVGGVPASRQTDLFDTLERSWTLNGKLWYQMANAHSLLGGLEVDSSELTQSRTTVRDGLAQLNEFGDDLNAATLRVATYAQDEWKIKPNISAYAGLRWEAIRTTSERLNLQTSNTSSVATPLLHASWKPSEDSRDQVRMSLTRSYKSATLQDLIARPSVSQRFPTGANEIGSPDRAGNPDLRPELATGVELGYEHYLPKGGLFSANVFYRDIDNLIRRSIGLENVSWSTQPRWVSRPKNVGNAKTYGLELEAKFRLDELWSDALPLSLRTNLSLFDAKVDGVPGPDNRLEGQPKGTANVGFDYRLRGLPLSLGGSVNYTPAYDITLSDVQSNTVSAKILTDAFVLWTLSPATQLRLSAGNLTPRTYLTSNTLANGNRTQINDSTNPSSINWGLRLEVKI